MSASARDFSAFMHCPEEHTVECKACGWSLGLSPCGECWHTAAMHSVGRLLRHCSKDIGGGRRCPCRKYVEE